MGGTNEEKKWRAGTAGRDEENDMHQLIRIYRGKETVMMTDSLPKVNDHVKKMRASQRKGINGQRVEYVVREAPEDAEKYKRPPTDMYLGGANRKHPRVPRK